MPRRPWYRGLVMSLALPFPMTCGQHGWHFCARSRIRSNEVAQQYEIIIVAAEVRRVPFSLVDAFGLPIGLSGGEKKGGAS